MHTRPERLKKSALSNSMATPLVRSVYLVYVICIAIVMIQPAESQCNTATQDNAITDAFQTGLGDADTQPDMTTRNGTLVLKADGMEKSCHLCTPAMQRHMARNLGTAAALARSSESPITLRLTHFSDTDTIWIDGIVLPAHIHSIELTPRSHFITVKRNAVSAVLSISAQTRPQIDITPADMSFSHLHTGLLRTGVLLAALGTSLASIGVAFTLLHGDCATTKINNAGDCEDNHQLKPQGIAFAAAGATLLGVGIGLIAHRHRLLRTARNRFLKGQF